MPIRNEKRTQNVILLFLCAVLASFLLMCWPRRKPRNVTLDVFVWICVCASLIVCLCEWARALLLLLLLNNCCIAMRNGQCMYQCVWSSVSTLDKIIWKKKEKKRTHTTTPTAQDRYICTFCSDLPSNDATQYNKSASKHWSVHRATETQTIVTKSTCSDNAKISIIWLHKEKNTTPYQSIETTFFYCRIRRQHMIVDCLENDS